MISYLIINNTCLSFFINILVFMQLAWEFNRVMGKDVVASVTEKWIKMLPKIITTAEEESKVVGFIALKKESGID